MLENLIKKYMVLVRILLKITYVHVGFKLNTKIYKLLIWNI